MKALIGEAEDLHGDIEVPDGSITAAACWMIAAATAHHDANLVIKGVNMDPARNGIIDAMMLMGSRVEVQKKREVDGKTVADIWVRASWLRGAQIPADVAVRMVDEIPLLTIAAAVAEGTTIVFLSKAEREKSKDSFPLLAKMLGIMQVYSEQADQGILIEGEEHFHGGDYDTEGDGRMALTFGIAGLIAAETIVIENPECANDYYPGFWDAFNTYTKGQVRFA